jgi:anti-sigma factor RsiW
MEHAAIQPKLSDYLDDAVAPEEKAAIEKHLPTCAECRQALAELGATRRHAKSLPEVEPPPWLTSKIMARVREQASQKKGLFQRLFYPLHIKLPVEAVGLIFLTVAAYLIVQKTQPEMKPLLMPPKEVYERAQPSSPQTATPLESSKERMQVKGRADELHLAEKPAAPVPKAGQASPSESSAAKSATQAEGARKEAAAPEPQADRRMKLKETAREPAEPSEVAPKQAAPPAPPAQAAKPLREAASREERREAERPALAGKGLVGRAQTLRFSLEVKDVTEAGTKIEEAVTRLGGKIIKKESFENAQILSAEVEAKKMDELLATLGRMGEIKDKVQLAREAEGSRVVTIKILPIPASP